MGKEVSDQRIKSIRDFQKGRSSNRRCFDCNELGPQYVCLDFNTFICTSCSGIHREFAHRVKSISMSEFTDSEVTNIVKYGGNENAQNYWLARFDLNKSATSLSHLNSRDRLRKFIRDVYIDRKWVMDASPEVTKKKTISPETSKSKRTPVKEKIKPKAEVFNPFDIPEVTNFASNSSTANSSNSFTNNNFANFADFNTASFNNTAASLSEFADFADFSNFDQYNSVSDNPQRFNTSSSITIPHSSDLLSFPSDDMFGDAPTTNNTTIEVDFFASVATSNSSDFATNNNDTNRSSGVFSPQKNSFVFDPFEEPVSTSAAVVVPANEEFITQSVEAKVESIVDPFSAFDLMDNPDTNSTPEINNTFTEKNDVWNQAPPVSNSIKNSPSLGYQQPPSNSFIPLSNPVARTNAQFYQNNPNLCQNGIQTYFGNHSVQIINSSQVTSQQKRPAQSINLDPFAEFDIVSSKNPVTQNQNNHQHSNSVKHFSGNPATNFGFNSQMQSQRASPQFTSQPIPAKPIVTSSNPFDMF